MPNRSPQILVISATQNEMISAKKSEVDTLVTGIGMVATTHWLTRQLVSTKYDLVIDIGIAGSFNPNFEIGAVVQVISDRIVELGVEDHGNFIPADEMNLCTSDELQFNSELNVIGLPKANGITVNRVHGSVDSIEKVVAQFNPDVETMEGAAVAYVCKQFGVPWVQIRAISNRVEPRNRDAWNVSLAIQNLHFEVLKYIDGLSNEA